jgi:outer membrane protein W
MLFKQFIRRYLVQGVCVLLSLPGLLWAADPEMKSFYVIGSMGAHETNWLALMPESVKQSSLIKNGEGGFVYGGTVGYRFTKQWAVQLEYFNLQGFSKDTAENAGITEQDDWLAASTIVFSPTVVQNRYVRPYFGIGLAHREIIEKAYHQGQLADRGVLQGITPTCHVGLDLSIASNWFVEMEYRYVTSFSSKGVTAPNTQLFHAGLGIAF